MNELQSRGGKSPGSGGECDCKHYLVHVLYADCIPKVFYFNNGVHEVGLSYCQPDYHYVAEFDGAMCGKHGDLPVSCTSHPIDAYYTECGALCIPKSGINSD